MQGFLVASWNNDLRASHVPPSRHVYRAAVCAEPMAAIGVEHIPHRGQDGPLYGLTVIKRRGISFGPEPPNVQWPGEYALPVSAAAGWPRYSRSIVVAARDWSSHAIDVVDVAWWKA